MDAPPATPGAKLLAALWKPIVRTEGEDLRTGCPACGDKDNAGVNTDTGIWHCWSCQAGGSPYDFALACRSDPSAARDAVKSAGLWKTNGEVLPAPEAVCRIEDGHLVIDATGLPKPDILDAIATAKHCPAASLRAYGAAATISGHAIEIPMHGADGLPCSTQRLTAAGKGIYAAGKPVGLFLPGRTPQPGETWYIVEGAKDAAALHGLGYNAAGLPGSTMPHDHAAMFRGCTVVIVPDRDKAGEEGARKSAAALHLHATVRVATLPMPYRETRGPDVRDTLQAHGADALRKALMAAHRVDGDGNPVKMPAFAAMLSTADFLALDIPDRYHVAHILECHAPCIIGGRSKTLKTSLTIDLALSVASGTPFLGHDLFTSEAAAVGIWSGESGPRKLRHTARSVAAARGLDLASLPVYWSFDLPKLCDPYHIEVLAEAITTRGVDVAIIDPLYLSLLSANSPGRASDLFYMGSILEPLRGLCQDAGVTLILLHHFRKNSLSDDAEPAGLEELSQAGLAEWARQWILLQRRAPYQSDGLHQLYLRAGGSSGHAGLYAVDINEGTPDERKWATEVKPVDDAKLDAEEAKEVYREKRAEARAARHANKLMPVLTAATDPLTKSQLSESAHLSRTNTQHAIDYLLSTGQITEQTLLIRGQSRPAYSAYTDPFDNPFNS